MTQERVVYFNGQIIPESQAAVPIRDRGFLYGDAVFDTTRTFGGEIFKLDRHLDRFFDSLRYMRLDPGLSKAEFADITMRVLAANLPLLDAGGDYWVTQRATRGVPGGGPTTLVECVPLPFAQRAKHYRDGMPVIVPSVRRTPPESMSPRAKMHNYINLVLATQEVEAQNPDAWPILLDIRGNICEGPGANIFLVKNGEILTPREQLVLAGVSRETAIDLARELGMPLREADLDLYDAYTADEAFITSTSFCIVPVASFNGNPIGGGGMPGPVTDRLTKAYSGLVGVDIAGQYLAHLG